MPSTSVSAGPIGIAGAGRLGTALGRLLQLSGMPVAAIASRDWDHARRAARFIGPETEAVVYGDLPRQAGQLLIAVPDDAIGAVAATLASAGAPPRVVLHTSGSRGLEVLAPLAAAGASCGAIHPLQTVASPEAGVRVLPGCSVAVTGEGLAAEWAEDIVRRLGGYPLRVDPAARPLYHAAAAMASNSLIAVLDAAVMLMGAAGIAAPEALRALGPLARAACENALTLGPAAALTGPVERGDLETVAAHWRNLEPAPATVRELYRASALQVLDLARRKRPALAADESIRALLDHA